MVTLLAGLWGRLAATAAAAGAFALLLWTGLAQARARGRAEAVADTAAVNANNRRVADAARADADRIADPDGMLRRDWSRDR